MTQEDEEFKVKLKPVEDMGEQPAPPTLPPLGGESSVPIGDVLAKLKPEGKLYWDLAVAEATLEVVVHERAELIELFHQMEAIDS